MAGNANSGRRRPGIPEGHALYMRKWRERRIREKATARFAAEVGLCISLQSSLNIAHWPIWAQSWAEDEEQSRHPDGRFR
jgi:hypothetical protein